MYAYAAVIYVKGYCRMTFKNPENMESTVLSGDQLDCFDLVGTGSHKYIPTERLNNELGLPQGGGVYNYVKMKDGSYILLTCRGPLAYWSGKADEPAKFPKERGELI